MIKLITTILIFMFLITACQGGDDSTAENDKKTDTAQPEYIGYTILSQGIQTGFKEAGDVIVTNKEQLDSIWKIHYSYMSFVPESPNIDFDEEIVIGVFLGEKPSTGYWLKLDTIYVANNEEIVEITLNEKPDTSKDILTVATYPYFIAAITKTDYDLKFDFLVE